MLYKSYGNLVYEADIYKTPGALSDNWIVLRCCNDLVNYYQYWLNKKGFIINASSWKPHISVVKGEKMNKDVFNKWLENKGRRIYFDYDDTLRRNDRGFIWVNCFSKELNELRGELGLYLRKDNRFHLTVCKLKEGIVYLGIEEMLMYDP